jgi:DNA-binding Lrp family transcriptional regulator
MDTEKRKLIREDLEKLEEHKRAYKNLGYPQTITEIAKRRGVTRTTVYEILRKKLEEERKYPNILALLHPKAGLERFRSWVFTACVMSKYYPYFDEKDIPTNNKGGEYGDYSTSVAKAIARNRNESENEVAEEIVEKMKPIVGVYFFDDNPRIEIKDGFINYFVSEKELRATIDYINNPKMVLKEALKERLSHGK